MIKHIVFWKLKDEALDNSKQQNLKLMKEKLESLKGKIDGLLEVEVGTNYNPKGYDICLVCTLSSKEALDLYQIHPEQVKVKDFVVSVTNDRAVVDYEI